MLRFLIGLLVCSAARPASADVVPVSYDLSLLPDRSTGRFEGRERIELDVRSRTRVIRLDAVGLDVERVDWVSGERRRLRVRRDRSGIVLASDRAFPPGRAIIDLAWRGRLSHDLRGLYTASDGARGYVLTQLEPGFARHVFPCFDEPSLRARFRVHARVGAGEQAISNGAVVHETAEGAFRWVDFAETPPIPPYLVALAVGELDAVEGQLGALPVRVLAPPGHRAGATRALQVTLKLLTQLESYLQVPFPFAKLDVVAAPELAIHGMENAGAIFVRGGELLRGDELAERTLAHELAHQWFGDLVTMSSWRDLWLSESLARFFEFDVVDRVHPEWLVWTEFRRLRDHVLGVDARAGAHAIRGPARPTFDEITYDKGAAALWMLRTWMGAESFRAALHEYLEQHAFAAVDAAAFWRAIADHSSDDLVSLGTGWFEQPGHPLLQVESRCEGGALRIELRQRRDGAEAVPQIWRVPVWLHTSGADLRLILDRPRQSLLLRDAGGCSPVVAVDVDGEQPYRVHYSSISPPENARRHRRRATPSRGSARGKSPAAV